MFECLHLGSQLLEQKNRAEGGGFEPPVAVLGYSRFRDGLVMTTSVPLHKLS